MKKSAISGFAMAILAIFQAQPTHAEQEKIGGFPPYLFCDGIMGDQKEARTFKITANSIFLWNRAQSKWGVLCDETIGQCAINAKTISYASDYSIMVISRSTGQFEGHLSSGATWIGACTTVDDPGAPKVQTGPAKSAPGPEGVIPGTPR